MENWLPSSATGLSLPVDNPAPGEIVRRDFQLNAIAGDDPDEVFSQLAGDMGGYEVTVIEFDAETRVRERFGNGAVHFDRFLFDLRHSPPKGKTWSWRVPAGKNGYHPDGVKDNAPRLEARAAAVSDALTAIHDATRRIDTGQYRTFAERGKTIANASAGPFGPALGVFQSSGNPAVRDCRCGSVRWGRVKPCRAAAESASFGHAILAAGERVVRI
jgi:hypothetical protein